MASDLRASGVMHGRRRSGSGRRNTMVNGERLRLDEADTGDIPWRSLGPYLSGRQWAAR
jgi:hypothetical protein